MNNTAYKCPNCGGNLLFDSDSGQLKCEQCDSLFQADFMDQGGADPAFQNEEEVQISTVSGQEMEVHVFKCDSCGGELTVTEKTAATRCPYCGSPNIIFNKVTNDLRPDVILPFKIDREKVEEIYWKKIGKHKFVPRDLRKKAAVDKLTATYIPYWLFSGTGIIDADCHGTKVHHSSDATYHYTHTDHFEIKRKIKASYENVSWDASKEMEDDRMQVLEPFDMNELKPFENGYLLGYQAERYDVSKEEAQPSIEKKVKKFLTEEVRNSIEGYSTTSIRKQSESIQWQKQEYAMFPIWNYHYQYGSKKYEFLINGQTGKFVGKLPSSLGAFLKWFFILMMIATLLLSIGTDFRGKDVSQNRNPENVAVFSMDGQNHLMDVQDTYIDRQRTYDHADLLTTQEENELEERLDELSEKYLTDFIALTVDSTNGYSTELYAENFIDYNGFGFTPSHDSVEIMVDMENRMIWITGTGRGEFYITDERADEIYENIAHFATDKAYDTMFENGFNEIESYYQSNDFKTGNVSYYDLDRDTRKMLKEEGKEVPMIAFFWLKRFLFGALLSLVLTLLWWLIDHRSKTIEVTSEDFCKKKEILTKNDKFIHTTTTRTKRSSSSSGGGGSSHGGSGRSHSGGGGRF